MHPSRQETGIAQPPQETEAVGSIAVAESTELSMTDIEGVIINESAPQGWVTVNELAQELRKGKGLTREAVDSYREEYPDYFKIFRQDSTHRLVRYLSPELVALLKQDREAQTKPAPKGWMSTNALARYTGASRKAMTNVVGDLIEEHPEWVGEFHNNKGQLAEHFHSSLVERIIKKLPPLERAPEEWISTGDLVRELKSTQKTVRSVVAEVKSKNPDHPGWFKTYKSPKIGKGGGKRIEYFEPSVAELVRQRVKSLQVGKGIGKPVVQQLASTQEVMPEGWMIVFAIAKELGVDSSTIKKAASVLREEYPEWFKVYHRKGREYEHYSPEVVDHLRSKFSQYELAPGGWVTFGGMANEVGVTRNAIDPLVERLREEHPEWFRLYRHGSRGYVREHLHPELVEEVVSMVQKHGPAPEGWMTTNGIAQELGKTTYIVKKAIDNLMLDHPDWEMVYRNSHNRAVRKHYHPDLIALVNTNLSEIEPAPEGWVANRALARQLRYSQKTVEDLANELLQDHPEQSKIYLANTGRPTRLYSPELAGEIRKQLDPRDESIAEVREIRRKAEEFLSLINKNETIETQEIKSLVELFGAERIVDILFQYRPDYKKLDLPYVRRIIGDYLGDFLAIRGDLQLENLEDNLEYLSSPSLKEGLTEIIKNNCLRFYNEKHKEDPSRDDQDILALYIDDLRGQTANFQTPELAEGIDDVARYYRSLFEDFQKPECLVDELKDGRRFPDLNQRINIKEIELKQKMLIADEMGVGKSASAILAKESLGIRQALIVVPSNVTEVWLKYLSDQVAENGDAAGYFKPGHAPNVLVVDSLKELSTINSEDYDYVVLSQERLTNRYLEALEKFDYGMLIVDEVHKLKNIASGKRADNLIKLAARIEDGDENKYLALLSGTPVPNKVGDIAMVLRLLYPEKFEHIDNKELTRQILLGDVLNLRSLLVPRMQMKSLAESIEMPNLHEELHVIELSKDERDHYEVLLEEDELTASQKLQALRQFILNPRAFEAVPGIESSKIRTVGKSLQNTYLTKDKVVMFINGYVNGVIRGKTTIFDGLGLPNDVQVETIDGNVSKAKRLELQSKLKHSKGKLLLAVSGMTADVGVDFSGAEELYFYNEPWTEYDKKQQQGRVYRPGLHQDLVSHTFYVKDTVEEGIHRYIEFKYRAIEKLLRGIPLSELETRLLREDEKQADPNLEVNPTLAEHYLSSWGRMLKIYNHVKEIGEPNFQKFLSHYAREYAECYTELGARSYQANANRLSGTVIDKLVKNKGQDAQFVRIVDVASGPEMLKRHIVEEYQDQIISVDLNHLHFEELDDKRRVGSFLDLPIADSSVDYANLALALHYSKLVPSRGNYERIGVFKELNRVLVNDGVAVINNMHTSDLKHPEFFEGAVEKMGFKIVEQYSGEVSSANNFRTRLIVLQKFADCPSDTQKLVQSIGSHIIGLKFRRTGVKLKDSRRIVTSFVLGSKKNLKARLNLYDQAIFEEEQKVLKRMNRLKRQHGLVKNIPPQQIATNGLSRAFTGKTYVLFKSLESGNGAVITR